MPSAARKRFLFDSASTKIDRKNTLGVGSNVASITVNLHQNVENFPSDFLKKEKKKNDSFLERATIRIYAL